MPKNLYYIMEGGERLNQELKDLIIQAENEEVGEELAQCDEPIECSRKHKLKMNRIFRELVQSKFLPFPEVDSIYERVRSWLIVKLHLSKFIYRNNR